jgi:MoaA/NifB/PqqE/SkfB family radical SAM enzyme
MFSLKNIEGLVIELTNQCNAACPACAREIPELNFDSKKDKAEITVEQFKQYFNKAFLRKLKKIAFTGNFGDPIMAKDVYDIIKYIKQSNPLLSINISTNGSMRSANWWNNLGKLMQYSKDIVVWAIDGLEDTSSKYRVNTKWNKIIENVKAFIAGGGHAHWAMLVFDYNEHQVNDCKNLAQELGFDEFISKHSRRHAINIYNNAFPRESKNYNVHPNQSKTISCAALYDKSIYISADSIVLPCCQFGDRQYLQNLSNSHPGILSKNNFNLENIENIIDAFNIVTETWMTDTPVDVCKFNCSCSYNKNDSTYSFNKKEIVERIVF